MANKNTSAPAPAKSEAPKQPSGRKETFKTIALTALIAMVVAFVAGVHYQQGQDAKMQSGISQAVTSLKVLRSK